MGLLADNMSLAEDLSHYSRLCYDRHLVGAAGGNVSARLPGEQGFLVTASGVALRDVSPANLMVVDVDNHVLENPANGKPSKEAGFHLVIYRDWPETGAVIHVHPAHATVYSALGQLIPLVTISATLKLKQGPLVPEAPPGSVELSNNVAQALAASPSNASILLLERHGIIGFDKNLCAAFDDVELAEDTAKIALLTANARERASSAVPTPDDRRPVGGIGRAHTLLSHRPAVQEAVARGLQGRGGQPVEAGDGRPFGNARGRAAALPRRRGGPAARAVDPLLRPGHRRGHA